MKKDIQEGWKLLNKKDPITWNKKDFEKVWNSEQFHDEMAGGFEEHHATHFHNLMRAIDRHDLLEQFKGKKSPAETAIEITPMIVQDKARLFKFMASFTHCSTFVIAASGFAGIITPTKIWATLIVPIGSSHDIRIFSGQTIRQSLKHQLTKGLSTYL